MHKTCKHPEKFLTLSECDDTLRLLQDEQLEQEPPPPPPEEQKEKKKKKKKGGKKEEAPTKKGIMADYDDDVHMADVLSYRCVCARVCECVCVSV